jgi:formylglycine-generating enzyme required for sulfatase activity
VAYLYGQLLDARPGEVPVIREALAPHQEELVGKLWAVVEAPEKRKESQRLRAAAALAEYDPKSGKWAKAARLVVNDLVRENAVFLGQWSEAFRPVKNAFLAPLADTFHDQRPERAAERSLATNLLADYAAADPHLLANLLMDGDEKQFAVIYPKLGERGVQGLALLAAEIDKKLPADLPSADKEREKLAKRQANAAVALLRLGQPEKVWPLLKRTPPDDPRVRSYVMHRLGPLGADWGAVFKQLDEEKDVSVRRALLLSLGAFGPEQLSPADRKALIPKVLQVYREDPDAGLHGAAEWLLRHWGQQGKVKEFEAEWAGADSPNGRIKVRASRWAGSSGALAFASTASARRPFFPGAARFTQPVPLEPPPAEKDPAGQRKRKAREEHIKRELVAGGKGREQAYWYVNGQGQTMVVIPGPVEFLMGSPPTEQGRYEPEVQHRKRIGRTFALAARPVTVQEFRRFLRANPNLEKLFQGDVAALLKRYSPEADCPMTQVDWYKAAAYCNWLSDQENLEKCYQEDAQGNVVGLKAKYLSLTGYRLPTEAEWEYACRAGAVTSRCYGESEELLRKYAWYFPNGKGRSRPVGGKKPNDLGLFDMHGNVWTWCQERYRPFPKGPGIENDIEDILSINKQESRVLRCGSFIYQAVDVRSAVRYSVVPTFRSYDVGFRPARTFAP